jgi:hypothetical protein
LFSLSARIQHRPLTGRARRAFNGLHNIGGKGYIIYSKFLRKINESKRNSLMGPGTGVEFMLRRRLL